MWGHQGPPMARHARPLSKELKLTVATYYVITIHTIRYVHINIYIYILYMYMLVSLYYLYKLHMLLIFLQCSRCRRWALTEPNNAEPIPVKWLHLMASMSIEQNETLADIN